MATLRASIKQLGSEISPEAGEALLAVAQQYVADGHTTEEAGQMTLRDAHDAVHEQLASVHKQLGIDPVPQSE